MLSAKPDTAQISALCDKVWATMARYHILPLPSAYAVWFAHCEGTNLPLSRHIVRLLDQQDPLDPHVMDMLHETYLLGAALDPDALALHSDGLVDAAQDVIDHIATSEAATQGYGATLARWTTTLKNVPAMEAMVSAVAHLSSETAAALARNQRLQQELGASTSRIRKLQHSLSTMRQQAATDALTGLANRRALDSRLRSLVAQSRTDMARAEVVAPTSLMMLDLDHFRLLNETHGRDIGDLVLRLVARLLADSVKGRDMAVRYGGEEFAMLLDGVDLQAAIGLASRICTLLSSKRLTNRGSRQDFGHVTVSIGVAQYRPGETAAALVGRADAALWRAKERGRNRACTAEDEHALAATGHAAAPGRPLPTTAAMSLPRGDMAAEG